VGLRSKGGTHDGFDAVNFARDHDLVLSIKAGGHNVAGNAVNDGGLVIDLSQMTGVHVDPTSRTARVQGGAPRWATWIERRSSSTAVHELRPGLRHWEASRPEWKPVELWDQWAACTDCARRSRPLFSPAPPRIPRP
jgi:hypothetical protein